MRVPMAEGWLVLEHGCSNEGQATSLGTAKPQNLRWMKKPNNNNGISTVVFYYQSCPLTLTFFPFKDKGEKRQTVESSFSKFYSSSLPLSILLC